MFEVQADQWGIASTSKGVELEMMVLETSWTRFKPPLLHKVLNENSTGKFAVSFDFLKRIRSFILS